MSQQPVTHTQVTRFGSSQGRHTTDLVAVEEPLQIIVEHGETHARQQDALAITMRTPGDDLDLVRGFMLTSGVIRDASELISVRACLRAEPSGSAVRAAVQPGVVIPAWVTRRKLPSTSACGVCGADTIEALVDTGCAPVPETAQFTASALHTAARSLQAPQTYFRHTGGTHAAAWFDKDGSLLAMREDVGRHNAMDKIIGAMMLQPHRPRSNTFCVTSSRSSFELVQKTVRAGVPVLAALGAPSSLAIDLAAQYNATLVGFLADDRFNVYAGEQRIMDAQSTRNAVPPQETLA